MKKLLTMVLVLCIIGMATGCKSSEQSADDLRYGNMKNIVETYVSGQLRSPSTAKFDNNLLEDNITELGGNRYQYNGYVDAENGFGADVRTYFTLTARDEGNDKWIVESFDTY